MPPVPPIDKTNKFNLNIPLSASDKKSNKPFTKQNA